MGQCNAIQAFLLHVAGQNQPTLLKLKIFTNRMKTRALKEGNHSRFASASLWPGEKRTYFPFLMSTRNNNS